jgi:diguanylate cyclase (GGDEF)-like protein
MTPPRSQHVWLLTLGTLLVAAGLDFFCVRPLAEGSHAEDSLAALAGTAAAFVLAESLLVHVRFNRQTYSFSLSELPLVVGLFLLSPDVLVHARLIGAVLVLLVQRRQHIRKMAFNIALFAVETIVAVLLWHLVVGGRDPLGPWGWAAVGVVVLALGVVGSGMVSLAMRLDGGEWPSGMAAMIAPGIFMDLLNGVFALIVVYVVTTDWRAAWVILVLVVVLAASYRSYTRLREHSERLESLNRFIRAMGEQLDVPAIAAVLLTEVNQALGGEQAVMTLDHRFEADTAGAWSYTHGDPGPIRLDGKDGFVSWLSESVGEGLLLRRGRERRRAGPTTVKDLVAVPLRCDGKTVGALTVLDRLSDQGTFTEDDLSELAALAGHASVALENARLADLLRRQMAEQEHQALHDELTGLPNRRLFRQELTLALRRSDTLAVLLLDLDRFKEINDTLGHQVGDEMLCVAASRLLSTAPPGSVVARFGGDEFGVLLRGFDERSAITAAQWIRHALARPYELGGLTFAVDLSIGVASSRGTPDTDALVRHADVAMYAAKSAGTGVEPYRAELDRNSPERLTLLADLRQALRTGGLSVMYQPKTELRDGAVRSVEALLRWNHPRLGFIPPDEFIPIAEHSGLITPLTMFVLQSALAQREAWRRGGIELEVAVNISPRSLADPDFADQVTRFLRDANVPPSALTLEITETSLMEDPDRAIVAMRRLRELGVSLSVDDLGTGYSSLSYLLRLPVDEVKIDRSFLPDLADDPDARAVVGAIVELGHRLGRRVVAEGVEDEATWRHLRDIGCDAAQGYWMSRPLPGDRIPAWLEGWRINRPAPLPPAPLSAAT